MNKAPMTEREAEEKMQKAQEAMRIINSPIVEDALRSMREKVYTAIESSRAGDEAARTQAYYMLRAIAMFDDEFKRKINDGKKAKSFLDSIKRRVKSIAEFSNG